MKLRRHGPNWKVGSFELGFLERTRTEHARLDGGLTVWARTEPFAVVVRNGPAVYVLDMDGGRHDLGDAFADEVIAAMD